MKKKVIYGIVATLEKGARPHGQRSYPHRGKKFFLATMHQHPVEDLMTHLGYGCTQYSLSFAKMENVTYDELPRYYKYGWRPRKKKNDKKATISQE